ncbi:MAG: hypothetical protein COS17_06070 [Elusimicrobia bacterium CG02_land_8_20_14_3_00_37_13]|nr:MAG: hypothetical protein COS17_06070 [Elusimicrobia bacterium CG02_land_8_20_14_3_00_37_13]
MLYCRFIGDKEDRYGIIKKDEVYEVRPDFFHKFTFAKKKFPLNKIKLLAPCLPTKIVALGLNYTDHAKELKMKILDEPIIFIKPSCSVIGPEDKIIFPKMAKQVDYEAELAVVVKKTAKHVPEDRVNEYILGYTCFNDVTARDLQKKDGQWTRAKSFDTFSPIGPWITDEVDPDNLKIEAYLNGKCVQSSWTSNMIFPVKKIFSFISQIMTLHPGDVIATGTPVGVGPMKPGDRVEIKIEKIGVLRNYIIRESKN